MCVCITAQPGLNLWVESGLYFYYEVEITFLKLPFSLTKTLNKDY